jgi:ribosomal protein S18 acetylase RimI-like enzyme
MVHVADIERATVAACAVRVQEELPGWLVPLEPGSVGRARSAVPLRHDGVELAAIGGIVARYAARGLAPQFRLADVAGLDAVRAALEADGFVARSPTSLQLAAAEEVAASAGAGGVVLAGSVADEWLRAFASSARDVERSALVRRLGHTTFASAHAGGAAVAVGAVTFAHGLGSVHSMRTLPEHRRRGHAARVLSALASAALARGVTELVLQVEVDNHAAVALYRRAGFAALWRYRYFYRSNAARP